MIWQYSLPLSSFTEWERSAIENPKKFWDDHPELQAEGMFK